MPWKKVSVMDLRREFVEFAKGGNINFSRLCERFDISRKTGYKWMKRHAEEGWAGLPDKSRRPLHSPGKTSDETEQEAVNIRKAHPAWGGRKIRARLTALGHEKVPSASTVTAILHRHGLIDPEESAKREAYKRFEHEAPNRLWQMDFKGWFELEKGRCHPLTVLDDHSRFSILLKACGNEQGVTVQAALTEAFQRYGLPARMTMDNGGPWGNDREHPYTSLTVWLIRLGIRVSHSRPYHPQTQGKDERFHRTLKAELLKHNVFHDIIHCQKHFDIWRDIYNLERPHEALGMAVPASRYQPSPRPWPDSLPAIEYSPGDTVRKVQDKGIIHYKGNRFSVSAAFKGYPVALRHTAEDGVMDVLFCQQKIAVINLTA
ncbi:MAG: IS481 family transposase [Gammaproteobacteria bacterium]|nr:IS481 family transposase [Gammaproteobacteria bacterium]